MALDKHPDDDMDDADDFPGKDKSQEKRRPPMDDRELVSILRSEEIDATSYYTSELAKDQANLMDRYMAKQYGDAQVLIWRRSYDTPPPALEADDPRGQRGDRRYANLTPEQIPLTECLKDTVARVVPYWEETIAPSVKSGQRVLIAAHGNSIRALIKHLDGISDADIVNLNIPNGIPLVYEFDDNMKPLRRYYLGDAEAAAAAAAAVASQGKA